MYRVIVIDDDNWTMEVNEMATSVYIEVDTKEGHFEYVLNGPEK